MFTCRSEHPVILLVNLKVHVLGDVTHARSLFH